ncbi:anaerobic ribonucleoside-triphosphate reductase [Shigella flexneri]
MYRITSLDGQGPGHPDPLHGRGLRGTSKGRRRCTEIFKHGRASIPLATSGYTRPSTPCLAIRCTCLTVPNCRESPSPSLRDRLKATDQWKGKRPDRFSLYPTPSEHLCPRFCRLDAKEFGVVAGVTDKGYYTNSFHPTWRSRSTRTTSWTSRRLSAIASGGFIC